MNGYEKGSLVLDKVKNMSITVSVTLLFTILGGAYYGGVTANAMYIGWHDARYMKRSEGLTLAQADQIKEQVRQSQQTADANSGKLDKVAEQISGIQVFLAAESVRQLQSRLDELKRSPENSTTWLQSRDALARQLKAATEYRDCLRQNGANCESLRSW